MAFLPYEAQLLCLVKTLSELDGQTLGSEQARRLRQWFWRSSFSQHFRGASEAFISQALVDTSAWVRTALGKPDRFGRPPEADGVAGEAFHFRGATSKAFVLALARRRPRNLVSGTVIDVGSRYLFTISVSSTTSSRKRTSSESEPIRSRSTLLRTYVCSRRTITRESLTPIRRFTCPNAYTI